MSAQELNYADRCKRVEDLPVFAANPAAWLALHAEPKMAYVLAQADDGVIWGQAAGGQLKLAGEYHQEVKVELRSETLQQARLFGPAGEIFIWRLPEGGFAARRIDDDGTAPLPDTLDDRHWLWGWKGANPDAEKGGFTLLVDGRQGLRHAPPIKNLGQAARVMLRVRHYVDYDGGGQAYIAGSRLVDVRPVEA